MPKHFNTAGPCDPAVHYMVPPERRLPQVRGLIEERAYFVVHAPRQTGKTTLFRDLARTLREEGRYNALLISCEQAQAAGADVEMGVATVLETLALDASLHLPPELRPPAPDKSLGPNSRLRDLLTRWSRQSSLPVVLFLDEIDSLYAGVLISVLRQLRSGFPERPVSYPQSVSLIGLRDVRDYRLAIRPDEETLGTSSPFNIKVESLVVPNFTTQEVAELYAQHTAETGQAFAPAARELAFELTGGQPWLVNALAREVVQRQAPDPGQGLARRPPEPAGRGASPARPLPRAPGSRQRHPPPLRQPYRRATLSRADRREPGERRRAADPGLLAVEAGPRSLGWRHRSRSPHGTPANPS